MYTVYPASFYSNGRPKLYVEITQELTIVTLTNVTAATKQSFILFTASGKKGFQGACRPQEQRVAHLRSYVSSDFACLPSLLGL
jgi:hypothetical protein